MTIDPIYLAAFALTSCAAAFALGRFCRNGNSTGAWEGATSTRYEGMAPLNGSACGFDTADNQRAVDALRIQSARALARELGGDEPLAGGMLAVGEPSPHADGKVGGE